MIYLNLKKKTIDDHFESSVVIVSIFFIKTHEMTKKQIKALSKLIT